MLGTELCNFISKTVEVSERNLIEKIKNLKQNYILNFDDISRLELKLRDLWDVKSAAILERNANFDTLNGERITPFFLKMAKGSHSVASMSEICDYNGLPFENVTDQKEFIRSHFANSFKKPEDEPDNLEGCIEEFLGDDICNHPLVLNLKLNENEKNSLELPFLPLLQMN